MSTFLPLVAIPYLWNILKMNLSELKLIENIEYKNLNLLNKYLGDISTLKKDLENSNLTINQWIETIKDKNKFFDVGCERIIYDKIYNAQQFGSASSWPIGSDLSFINTNSETPFLINIDCKSVSTYNIGDFKSDIFVGNNQNSYRVKFNVGNEKREYIPQLKTKYKLDDKDLYVLSYFVNVLYEPIPNPINPEKNIVRAIMLCCMPNGLLMDYYEDNQKKSVIKAGKTKELLPGQILILPDGNKYTVEEKDVFKKGKNSEKITICQKTGFNYEQILKSNKFEIQYVPGSITARFNYLDTSKFLLLDNKKRVDFLYLDNDEDFMNSYVKKYNPKSDSITTQKTTYKKIFNKFTEFSSDS